MGQHAGGCMSHVSRGAHRVLRALRQTQRPGFIFSPRYFYARKDPAVLFHRRLFFISCRRPVNVLINIIAYGRWIGYYAWRTSYRACKTRTDEHLIDYGLTRRALFWVLIKLALVHVIPPRYYFKHQLHQPHRRQRILNYVYNQEMPHFHEACNRMFPDAHHAKRLMGDKYQFSLALQAIGIPTVDSERYATCGLEPALKKLLQQKSIFCKPNTASQSRDAFQLQFHAEKGTYQLIPIQGPALFDRQGIERYLQKVVSNNKALLIQPVLVDHPEIKKISVSDAVTTVRIITEKSSSGPNVAPTLLYIQLEIPCNKPQASNTNPMQYYTLVPLDLNDLSVDLTFKKSPVFQAEHDILITEALRKLLRTSIDHCLAAHKKVLDLRSVSFDVILSDTGPLILEANYNGSIELLFDVIPSDACPSLSQHPAARWIGLTTGLSV